MLFRKCNQSFRTADNEKYTERLRQLKHLKRNWNLIDEKTFKTEWIRSAKESD